MVENERRKHPRIDSHNLVYLSIKDGDEIVQQGMGRTLNVSQSGIRLETTFAIKTAQFIWLTIGFMDETVEIKGELVYYLNDKIKHDYGIRFLEIDNHEWDILNIYIRNFNKEKTQTRD